MSALPLSPTRAPRRSTTAPVILAVRDLTVIYQDEPAIEHISLDVHAGERIAVIGPNGAGKSTLIKAIMGLVQPRSGSIELAQGGRERLGYVPQYEAVNWDFPVTVQDVVMMGCVRQIGWLRWPGKHHWEIVHAALERVGLVDFAKRQVGQLSGGQRRRVFIARALAQQADMLVLDEPFSGVDASAQHSLMDVLESLQADGMTIILSTHDLNLAFHRFDKVLAIKRELIAYGPPDKTYTPEVLTQLYGGKLAVLEDGRQVTVFIDDHECC